MPDAPVEEPKLSEKELSIISARRSIAAEIERAESGKQAIAYLEQHNLPEKALDLVTELTAFESPSASAQLPASHQSSLPTNRLKKLKRSLASIEQQLGTRRREASELHRIIKVLMDQRIPLIEEMYGLVTNEQAVDTATDQGP